MEETTMQKTERTERQDVYTRITAQIVADLEKGVHPWGETMERRTRRRPDYPSAAAQRPAL
jgi:antirestriction protein ArdC